MFTLTSLKGRVSSYGSAKHGNQHQCRGQLKGFISMTAKLERNVYTIPLKEFTIHIHLGIFPPGERCMADFNEKLILSGILYVLSRGTWTTVLASLSFYFQCCNYLCKRFCVSILVFKCDEVGICTALSLQEHTSLTYLIHFFHLVVQPQFVIERK